MLIREPPPIIWPLAFAFAPTEQFAGIPDLHS